MKITNNLVNLKPYFGISPNITDTRRNISKLQKVLEENGVGKGDIKELIAIVKSEEPDIESRQLGERANEWILKVFGKVVNGIEKINPNLTATSLATFIKEYYDIDD